MALANGQTHANGGMHTSLPWLSAMQRTHHGPRTVQRTHNRSAAPAHRATRPSLKNRPVPTWRYHHDWGIRRPLLPSIQPVSVPRRHLRSAGEHTTFAYSSGLPLTCPVFTQQIQRALLEAGVPDSRHYMSNSFWIGAATAAAEAGIPAWLIKTTGRWSSEAYLVYIRTPLATRLSVAERLTPATQTSTSRPLGPRTPCNPDLPS